MRTLQAYVDSKNKWRAVFGKGPLSLDSATDRQRIAETIDAELSPENLTCDGELSHSQVQARYRQLTTAARQLVELDPSVRQYIYEMMV
jgi:hypothetical protein